MGCANNHDNSILDDLERKKVLSSLFFGKAKWEKYFGDSNTALQNEQISEGIDLLAPVRLEVIESNCSTQQNFHAQDTHWICFFKEYVSYLLDGNKDQELNHLYRFLSRNSRFEPLRFHMYSLVRAKPELGLSPIPNEQTGFRYSYLESYRELQNRLRHMTLANDQADQAAAPDGIKVKIDVTQWGEEIIPQSFYGEIPVPETLSRYVKPALLEDLLDAEARQQALSQQVGNGHSTLWIKRQYPKSLHRVAALKTDHGESLHLKERPTHTPMEFAIVSLIHRLFGRGVTPSILARLTIELTNGDSYSTAVAISLTQSGKPLNELIKSETFETDHGIDPEEYTEQLISHVLILPTDAHGANILVTDQRPRRLISLDMEASFVPMRLEYSNEISFVSELFCHEVIPHLSPRVLARFNQIKTGDLLTAWLNEMLDNLEGWAQLFPNEKNRLLEPVIDSQDQCSLQREIRCLIQCLIPPGTVARLYRQITHLKQLFDTKKRIPISPFELLEGILVGMTVISTSANASRNAIARVLRG